MLDCQSCGACCVAWGDAPSYVYLDDDDVRRLPLHYRRRYLHKSPGSTHLKTKVDCNGTVCVAFEGMVGVKTSCGIYKDRPRVCRHFEPGSFDCEDAREEAGLTSSGRRQSEAVSAALPVPARGS